MKIKNLSAPTLRDPDNQQALKPCASRRALNAGTAFSYRRYLILGVLQEEKLSRGPHRCQDSERAALKVIPREKGIHRKRSSGSRPSKVGAGH